MRNIFELSKAICFSLRLGLNTTNCYTMQKLNKLEKFDKHKIFYDTDFIEPFISWKVADGTNDYAYPMSVDGHIFKTEYINNLCEVLEYSNPNLFEAMLSNFSRPEMIITCYEHSKLVKNHIKNHTNEDLNEMYLDAIIVNFNKFNFTEINGPSQEIKPIFKVCNEIINKVSN